MDAELLVAECDVGRGVFAARRFRAGERILVFEGEAYDRSHPIHETPQGANLLQVGPREYILPEPIGLYVNHSCNPNAGLRDARVLVALRDIAEGAEIRFDYSTNMDEDLWTMPCACGESICRGIVGDFKRLPDTVRATYLRMGIVPAFIADRYGPKVNGHGPGGRPASNGRPRANAGS